MFTPFAFIQTPIISLPPALSSTAPKLLIGGNFITFQSLQYRGIVKLDKNNNVDSSFNMGSGFNSIQNDIALTPEGKIFAVGQSTNYSGSTSYATRINSDGTRDTTWNAGTIGITTYVVLPFNDGTVFFGGSGTAYSQSIFPVKNAIVANSSGTVNSTYYNASKPLNGFSSTVNTAATQSDGKIIVGGSFLGYGNNHFNYFNILKPNGNSICLSNTYTGFNSLTTTVATQSDGKILVGGAFTTYSGSTVNRLTRLNTDGTRDVSFNTGLGPSSTPIWVKVQSDGKILVGGGFTSYNGSTSPGVVRINTNGTVDTSFNVGLGFTGGSVFSAEIQSDGNIVFIGEFTSYSGSARNGIVRTTNSGTIDPTFNVGNGFQTTTQAFSSIIQPDGKIIVGGGFTLYSGSSSTRIVRINTDGTKDTTFSGVTAAGFDGNVTTLCLQNDNKIIAGGSFTAYNSTSSARITRLNSDGTRDATYNVGAGLDNGFNYNPSILQSGSRIYAVGNFTTYSGSTVNRIICTNLSGALDPTFNTGAQSNNVSSVPGFNAAPYSIALSSSGDLLVASNATLYRPTYNIIRLNTDWTWDSSFKIGNGFNTSVNTIVVQPDDKILVGGGFTLYSASLATNYFTRLNADGTRDTTFNMGAANGFNSVVSNILVSKSQPGKIYVAGNFSSYSGSSVNRVVRLNASGSIDTTFQYSSSLSLGALQSDINEDSSGSLYIGNINQTSYGIYPVFNYFKLNPNGSLSSEFINLTQYYNETTLGLGIFNGGVYKIYIDSNDNKYLGGNFSTYKSPLLYNAAMIDSVDASLSSSFNIGIQGFQSIVQSFATQSNGKIIAAGSFIQYSGSGTDTTRIIRLNSNGTQDTTFVSGTGANAQVTSLAVQSDNKIIAVGQFTTYSGSTVNGIVRINPSGSRDTTFNVGAGFDFRPEYAVRLQSDGKVLVGGTFTSYSGSLTNRIIRLNTDGTKDTTFNVGTGAPNQVNDIKIQPDGKILIAGNFVNYSGSTNSQYLTRINPDGTRDTTFVSGVGPNSNVYNIHLQPDGKIIAMGVFTSYSGSAVNRIVRINPSGSRDTTFNVGTGLSSVQYQGDSPIVADANGSIYITNNFATYSGSTVGGFVKITPSGAIDTTFPTGSSTFNGSGINLGPASLGAPTTTLFYGQTLFLL